MIAKIIEKILYKIGILTSILGIAVFSLVLGLESALFYEIIYLSVRCIICLLFVNFIFEIDILIKGILKKEEKHSFIIKEKINFYINIVSIISYLFIIIFLFIIFNSNYGNILFYLIGTFYGIIINILALRRNIRNIKQKPYISKVNTIEILAYLYMVINIFGLIIYDEIFYISDMFAYTFINKTKILSIMIILILVSFILDVNLKRTFSSNEKFIKLKKISIILKILYLMFFNVFFTQIIPCILIIFELLKELYKYIKNKNMEGIFILFSIVAILCPILLLTIITQSL